MILNFVAALPNWFFSAPSVPGRRKPPLRRVCFKAVG